MRLYTKGGKHVDIEMTDDQIIQELNGSNFRGFKASINHDGNFDVTFEKDLHENNYMLRMFEDIHELFPELWVKHAYNGFSGNSFEFARRAKYAGQGLGV